MSLSKEQLEKAARDANWLQASVIYADQITELVRAAEKRGAAFAIKVVDDLHIGGEYTDTTDKLMKGIKNTIRDNFEAETGADPAPDYPVKVTLHPTNQVFRVVRLDK